MVMLKTLNRVLTARGINAELVKGIGYFYLVGPDVEYADSTSVWVHKVNDLSLTGWISEFETIAAESRKRKEMLAEGPKLKLVVSNE